MISTSHLLARFGWYDSTSTTPEHPCPKMVADPFGQQNLKHPETLKPKLISNVQGCMGSCPGGLRNTEGTLLNFQDVKGLCDQRTSLWGSC